MDGCNSKWWTSIRIAYNLCHWVGHWSSHGWSLESWHGVPKCFALNALAMWQNCVTSFPRWKTRKIMGTQIQWKGWICDCTKCMSNGVVHKMGYPQSRHGMESCSLIWMHAIWTSILNKDTCKRYMWGFLHCWNMRLEWWTPRKEFMVSDELDALECTCNEAWNMCSH